MLRFIAFQSPSVGFSTLLATILTAEAISGRDVTDKYDIDPTAYLYRLLESGERKQWNKKKLLPEEVLLVLLPAVVLENAFSFSSLMNQKILVTLIYFNP